LLDGVRSTSILRLAALGCLILAATAARADSARSGARVASPDGHDVAEVRPRALGGDAVYVSGARVWPRDASRSGVVTAVPRWSRSGHGIALLVREKTVTRLVVVLVHGEIAGQVLEWDVPPTALPAKVVTWLDAHRVSVGEREMEPKLVATWEAAEAAAPPTASR
jgi:hypothetical protein